MPGLSSPVIQYCKVYCTVLCPLLCRSSGSMSSKESKGSLNSLKSSSGLQKQTWTRMIWYFRCVPDRYQKPAAWFGFVVLLSIAYGLATSNLSHVYKNYFPSCCLQLCIVLALCIPLFQAVACKAQVLANLTFFFLGWVVEGGQQKSWVQKTYSLVHVVYLENGSIQVDLQFKMKTIAKLLKMWIVWYFFLKMCLQGCSKVWIQLLFTTEILFCLVRSNTCLVASKFNLNDTYV